MKLLPALLLVVNVLIIVRSFAIVAILGIKANPKSLPRGKPREILEHLMPLSFGFTFATFFCLTAGTTGLVLSWKPVKRLQTATIAISAVGLGIYLMLSVSLLTESPLLGNCILVYNKIPKWNPFSSSRKTSPSRDKGENIMDQSCLPHLLYTEGGECSEILEQLSKVKYTVGSVHVPFTFFSLIFNIVVITYMTRIEKKKRETAPATIHYNNPSSVPQSEQTEVDREAAIIWAYPAPSYATAMAMLSLPPPYTPHPTTFPKTENTRLDVPVPTTGP